MTDNPCNCENDCPNYIKKGEWCKVLGIVVGENRRWLMSRAGCLSHPLARENLMRDVIEELERKATKLQSTEPSFGTRMEYEAIANMQSSQYGKGEENIISWLLNEVISSIREQRERPFGDTLRSEVSKE